MRGEGRPEIQFRPARLALFFGPFAWQMIFHSRQHIGERLMGEYLLIVLA